MPLSAGDGDHPGSAHGPVHGLAAGQGRSSFFPCLAVAAVAGQGPADDRDEAGVGIDDPPRALLPRRPGYGTNEMSG
ncbi:hypothetical protein [Streptomyces sp. NPDC060054]|uniref:hypothetical protein n=1 Tax=unclassified Streptomyces TaxID=2593676 RepID=UPI000963B089|nr:hypothetical protein A6A29_22885 [Streptomyces sp. TSRI0281]